MRSNLCWQIRLTQEVQGLVQGLLMRVGEFRTAGVRATLVIDRLGAVYHTSIMSALFSSQLQVSALHIKLRLHLSSGPYLDQDSELLHSVIWASFVPTDLIQVLSSPGNGNKHVSVA